jgi:spermidine synthase/Tfp pilus assembly protein PilF
VLGGLALGLPSLAPPWDLHPLAVFRNNSVLGTSREEFAEIVERSSVIYYREGASANVSVVEGVRARALVIDGKTVATDGMSDMQHELLLGHLPVLMHPAPRSVAVIGLGAGITLGAVLTHDSPKRVLVIEIEPAVVDGARYFAHVNGRALDDPRLEIAFQDGRNYLLTTRELFDVITADPIHPWARGAAYLYTTEYYRLASEHLTDGGVMCQWLPLYELSLDNVRSAVATFADVFPHTLVWQTAHDAILIGANTPMTLDLETLGARLAQPRVRRQLSELGLADPLSLLAELALSGEALSRFTAGATRNTDDNLYLEFSSPLSVAKGELSEILAAFDLERSSFQSLVAGGEVLGDGGLEQQALNYRKAKQRTIRAQVALRTAEGEADPALYRSVIGELQAILDSEPAYGRARSILVEAYLGLGAQHLSLGRVDAALADLENAVDTMPQHAVAHHHLGTALSENGRLEEALPQFSQALDQRPDYPAARLNLGVTLLRLGRPREALGHLAAARELRPSDAAAHLMLATAQALVGQPQRALENFQQAEALQQRLPGLHSNYASFLMSQRLYAAAAAVLERGLAVAPGDPVLERQLALLLVAAPDEDIRDPRRARSILEGPNLSPGGAPETVDQLDLLAAAAAAEGDYGSALKLAAKASDLALSRGETKIAAQIAMREEGYRLGRPYRLPSR